METSFLWDLLKRCTELPDFGGNAAAAEIGPFVKDVSTFSVPGVNGDRSQGVTGNVGQSWHPNMSLGAFQVELKVNLRIATLPPKPPLLESSGKMALTSSKWTLQFFEFLVQNSIALLIVCVRPSKSDHSKSYVYAKSKSITKHYG